MTLAEAIRHMEHLCDVFPIDEYDEHIGVIEKIQNSSLGWLVKVSGHPEYGTRWFLPAALCTTCKVVD